MSAPELGLRDLPYDCAEVLLHAHLKQLSEEQLFCRYMPYCRIFLGPSFADAAAADPNHALWRDGCARFGLTRLQVDPTWCGAFERLCRERCCLNTFYRNRGKNGPVSQMEKLRDAIELNAVMHVACAVEAGIDVNGSYAPTCLLGRWRPLHMACDRGRPEIVAFLLGVPGIDPHVALDPDNNRLFSPLAIAAAADQCEVVDVLVRLGGAAADVNGLDCSGRTPLHRAVTFGQVNMVRQLLSIPGIEVDTRDHKGVTALLGSVRSTHDSQILPLLLDARADINARDPDGQTPLMYAAALKDHLKVRCLLARPDCDILASIPADCIFAPAFAWTMRAGSTALHYACIRGSCHIVSELSSHPKHRELFAMTDVDGNTGLHKAVFHAANHLQPLVETAIPIFHALQLINVHNRDNLTACDLAGLYSASASAANKKHYLKILKALFAVGGTWTLQHSDNAL
jgi:ankyrin repeat protein